MAAGKALRTIRDEKLYRPKFDNFEDYCEKRWGWKRHRAYQMIEAAETVKMLTNGQQIVSERQARALAAVSEDDRDDVIAKAKQSGKLTARSITQAARAEKPTVTIEMDKTGTQIPLALLDDWHRAEAFAEQLRKLSDVKCFVDDALQASDVIFREITNTVIAEMNNIYGTLRRVIPYAVCPTCAGHRPERCAVCKGRGFLSKFLWASIVPAEVKEMRRK